jgi:hypothetical protein
MIHEISFQDYCKLDGINASTLKYFHGEPFSPKSAVYNMNAPSKETEAFKIGRAVHAWLEYYNCIPDEYEILPFEKWNEKGAKKAKEECIASNAIPLTISEGRLITDMSNAVWNNELLNPILSKDSMQREVSITTDEFKAMMDVIDVDGRAIYDYKTTRRTNLKDVVKDCYGFGYHVQAYHYLMVANKGGVEADDFYFIFVSTVPPHETFVLKCSTDFIAAGERDWNIAKERFDKYSKLSYCDCPGLCEEIVELDLPEWASGEEDLTLFEELE